MKSNIARKFMVNLSSDDLNALDRIATINGLGSTDNRLQSHACRYSIKRQARNLSHAQLDTAIKLGVLSDDKADNMMWGFHCGDDVKADIAKIAEFHDLPHASTAIRFAIRRQLADDTANCVPLRS